MPLVSLVHCIVGQPFSSFHARTKTFHLHPELPLPYSQTSPRQDPSAARAWPYPFLSHPQITNTATAPCRPRPVHDHRPVSRITAATTATDRSYCYPWGRRRLPLRHWPSSIRQRILRVHVRPPIGRCTPDTATGSQKECDSGRVAACGYSYDYHYDYHPDDYHEYCDYDYYDYYYDYYYEYYAYDCPSDCPNDDCIGEYCQCSCG